MGEVTKGEPLQGLSLEIKKNAMGSHICTYTQTHTHTHTYTHTHTHTHTHVFIFVYFV